MAELGIGDVGEGRDAGVCAGAGQVDDGDGAETWEEVHFGLGDLYEMIFWRVFASIENLRFVLLEICR